MSISRKILTIIHSVSTTIFFILVIIAYVKLSGSEYHYMHNLGLNWNRGPIVSIQPSEVQCTETQQPLITNYWPGTSEGCYCNINTSLIYGPLRPGRCYKKRDNLLFCSTISEKPAIRWQNWRGKFICGKRQESSYLDLTISKRAESCPTSMKSCGIIDTLNNVLCVKNSEACPMNSIQIDTTKKDPNIPKDSYVINADGANIIFSNTNVKGKIINELYVGEEQPCADPEFANYNFKPYLLDKFYDKNKCSSKLGNFENDDSYIKVDKSNSQSLLKDNGVLNVLTTLPLYNPAEYNHEMSLYQRVYKGLDPDCHADINKNGARDNILTSLTEIESKIGWAVKLTLICLIFGGVIFLAVLFYSIIFFLCDGGNVKKDFYFYMIIPILFEISVLIMSIITNGYLNSYTGDNEIMQRPECVDELTYAASSNFYPSIASAKSLIVFNIVLTIISLVSKMLQILLFCKGSNRIDFRGIPDSNTEIVAPQNQTENLTKN